MLDPFTALAAVNTAIKLVKATVSTVKNLESLGPCLGQFFGAKEEAIKVIKAGGFEGSARQQAMELEMAIESARSFEEEVKMLFFTSNKMEIWFKIVARTEQITRDQIQADKRKREAKKRRAAEIDELLTIILILFVTAVVLGTVGWFVWEAMRQCTPNCAINR
jgi:hypothetical protein